MDADQLELFAAILFAARSSGPRELKERWLQGWRPKQPDAEEVAVGEFLNSLTSEQKALVIQAVTHFVDASFSSSSSAWRTERDPRSSCSA